MRVCVCVRVRQCVKVRWYISYPILNALVLETSLPVSLKHLSLKPRCRLPSCRHAQSEWTRKRTENCLRDRDCLDPLSLCLNLMQFPLFLWDWDKTRCFFFFFHNMGFSSGSFYKFHFNVPDFPFKNTWILHFIICKVKDHWFTCCNPVGHRSPLHSFCCVTNPEEGKHERNAAKKETWRTSGHKTEGKYRPSHVSWGPRTQTHRKPPVGIFIERMCKWL